MIVPCQHVFHDAFVDMQYRRRLHEHHSEALSRAAAHVSASGQATALDPIGEDADDYEETHGLPSPGQLDQGGEEPSRT